MSLLESDIANVSDTEQALVGGLVCVCQLSVQRYTDKVATSGMEDNKLRNSCATVYRQQNVRDKMLNSPVSHARRGDAVNPRDTLGMKTIRLYEYIPVFARHMFSGGHIGHGINLPRDHINSNTCLKYRVHLKALFHCGQCPRRSF